MNKRIETRTVINRAAAVIYYTALVAAIFSGGGLLYLKSRLQWSETPGPMDDRLESAVVAVVFSIAALLASGSGIWLVLKKPRRFLLGNLAFLLFTPLTLAASEALSRLIAPPWPAIGLSGFVPHSAASRQGRPSEVEQESIARGVGTNDWGQRDIPRTLAPAPGIRRIAFIGDSFLDYFTPMPINVRTEQKFNERHAAGKGAQPGLEVINLGVTGSSPDEYYYRLKHIGLPLGIHDCAVFVYAGNDFSTAPRTLATFGGIAAVSPRGSVLSLLGMRGLNHVLTNRCRPFFRNRKTQIQESGTQNRIRDIVLQNDDKDVPEPLHAFLGSLTDLSPDQSADLLQRLRSPEMASVYEMLRHPDGGLFEDYYLGCALDVVIDPAKVWKPMSDATAHYWMRKSFELCRERGIGFLLVIIPEGCQVDPRMYAQWKPLADMRRVTSTCRVAAQRLAVRARASGIPVLDLHDVLQDVPGTYLNVDGHWSDKGVEVVTDAVVPLLRAGGNP